MVYWLAWRRRSTESVSGYGACGAWRICPGSRTSGLPPISPRFAAYHRGHSRAMSTSDASGPSWAATMSHSVSPASTVTGPAPPPVAPGSGIAPAAVLASGAASRPGSTTGEAGCHPGLGVAGVGLSAVDCHAGDAASRPGGGTSAGPGWTEKCMAGPVPWRGVGATCAAAGLAEAAEDCSCVGVHSGPGAVMAACAAAPAISCIERAAITARCMNAGESRRAVAAARFRPSRSSRTEAPAASIENAHHSKSPRPAAVAAAARRTSTVHPC